MTQTAMEKAKEWAQNEYFDQKDRDELKELIESENTQEIEERFYQELEFGTGGLRNIIGFGSNRMNKYTIRKACQAIANTIIEEVQESKRLICIGYDSRYKSDEFAIEAAKVFAGNKISVKLFDTLCPTPLLSYSIKHFQACAGIMITASHNPAEYNGLKAYWSDASQLTPPIDNKVIQAYNDINDWSQIQFSQNDELIQRCGNDVLDAYTEMISNFICLPDMLKEKGHELGIAYTPLHGTGANSIKHVSNHFGLTNFQIVSSQEEPDHRFPTVSVPNPEYPAALAQATNLMKEQNLDIALGSDPDTDRLGVAYFDDNGLQFLDGNQIGVLLLDYKLSQLQEKNQLPKNGLIIKTIVTSEIQTQIAKHYGVRIENTLTGFKWMGKKMRQLKGDGVDFQLLLANEESYGYLVEDTIADKDGVSAYLLMCECALFHKLQGHNLTQALNNIYEKYGHFQESLLCLNYPGKAGKAVMNGIMEKFRADGVDEFAGFKIQSKTDLLNHPDFPKSNVLGLHFDNGNILWMRPSGTEPKIKFYTMCVPKSGIEAKAFIKKIEENLEQLS